MYIDILTLFPKILEGMCGSSILKRAQEKGEVSIALHDIRTYSRDKHHRVDDYPYGGEAGMVMTIQPIADAIEALTKERSYDEIIYMTPDGKSFNQGEANMLSTKKNLLILCGHYKGIDQRIRDIYITKEISIGDYVLTGGEIAAGVLVDAIVRLIPNVISDITSALSDSFQDNLLSPPVYTRPQNWKGHKVPNILLSGHEKKIEEWRLEQSIKKTQQLRPDLIKK